MENPEKPFFLFLLLASSLVSMATAKSTIEPCSSKDTCNSLLGYTLYTDLKVTEVARRNQKICLDALQDSNFRHLRINITDSIYGGLVSPEQIQIANSDIDSSHLDVDTNLVIPLPFACFNGTDESLPALILRCEGNRHNGWNRSVILDHCKGFNKRQCHGSS